MTKKTLDNGKCTSLNGVTLTVLYPEEEQTPEQELVEALLALIASFAGRRSGWRSRKHKALLSCAKQVLTEQEE